MIGTMAVRGVMEGMAVAVASPDKDFMQARRRQSCRPARGQARDDDEACGARGRGSVQQCMS